MEGSLIHQLVKTKQMPDEDVAPWVRDERFEVYYPAILTSPEGDERSIWPEKWPMTYLQGERHKTSFAFNFMNEPRGDGRTWKPGDITIVPEEEFRGTIISVDPAVTTKRSSDFTGIALLSYRSHSSGKPKDRRVWVRKVWKVKLGPQELRHKIAAIVAAYPEVRFLLVETNQGGDTWQTILGGLGPTFHEVKQSVKKEQRATTLHIAYQDRKVVHVEHLPALELELLAHPDGLNDDLIDAVGTGYEWLTGRGLERRPKPGRPRTTYYA
jgi:phage terminase large subunit-like protein